MVLILVLLFLIGQASGDDASWIVGAGGNEWDGNSSRNNTTNVQATGKIILEQLVSDYISRWTFDESNGTIVNDENTTSANIGTFNNPFWSVGRYGSAAKFGAVSSYVILGATPNELYLNDTDFTLTFWINKSSIVSGQYVITNKLLGGVSGYTLFFYSDDINLNYGNGTEAQVQLTENYNDVINAWSFIVVDFDCDTETVSFYQEGVFLESNVFTLLGCVAPSTSSLIIGADNDLSPVLNASLDELRIYTRLLSDLERDLVRNNSMYNMGNLTTWHDSGNGNETYRLYINATGENEANYSVFYRQNGTSDWTAIGTPNYTANQSIELSTKYQNTDVMIELYGNSTLTPELTSIVFWTQTAPAPTPPVSKVTLLNNDIFYNPSSDKYGIEWNSSSTNHNSIYSGKSVDIAFNTSFNQTIDRVIIRLTTSVGTPDAGNISVRVETDNAGNPSGILITNGACGNVSYVAGANNIILLDNSSIIVEKDNVIHLNFSTEIGNITTYIRINNLDGETERLKVITNTGTGWINLSGAIPTVRIGNSTTVQGNMYYTLNSANVYSTNYQANTFKVPRQTTVNQTVAYLSLTTGETANVRFVLTDGINEVANLTNTSTMPSTAGWVYFNFSNIVLNTSTTYRGYFTMEDNTSVTGATLRSLSAGGSTYIGTYQDNIGVRQTSSNSGSTWTTQSSQDLIFFFNVTAQGAPVPYFISWSNNVTNDNSTTIQVDAGTTINFNATPNEDVATWNWYLNSSNQNNNFNNFTYNFTYAGTHTVDVNVYNISDGTSNNLTWNINVQGYENISACGNLNTAFTTYNLIQNVSSDGSCFTIETNNITVDGKGYTLLYSNLTTGTYGISDIGGYDDITIRNFKIVQLNSSEDIDYSYAIYLDGGVSRFTIQNNSINTSCNYAYGIYTESATYGNVSDNIINTTYANGNGIQMRTGSDNNVLINNVVQLSNKAYGIHFDSSTNNTMKNNTITNPMAEGLFVDGETTYSHYNHSIDTSNSVEGKPLKYYYNVNDTIIEDNSSWGQLFVTASNNVTIQNITLDAVDNIIIVSVTNSLLRNSSVSNSKAHSTMVILSSLNTLDNNTLSSTSINKGLFIGQSAQNNTVENCNINSSDDGLYVETGSHYNTFFNNTIKGTSGHGVFIFTSTDNNLSNNVIDGFGSSGYGIYIWTGANNTVLNGNIITGHGSNGHGIYVRSAYNVTSINDTVTAINSNAAHYYLRAAELSVNSSTWSTEGRKIVLYDNQSKFNQSKLSDIWINANIYGLDVTTINRSVSLWTTSLIRWTELSTVTDTLNYTISGLIPSTLYYIYPDGTTNVSDVSGIIYLNETLTSGIPKQIDLSTSDLTPIITSVINDVTGNDSTNFKKDVLKTVTFNATADSDITSWIWYVNGSDQNNNATIFTYLNTRGTYNVSVSGMNQYGTSALESRNVIFVQPPEINCTVVIS